MEPTTRRQKTLAREIALATDELQRELSWWRDKAQNLQQLLDQQNAYVAETLGVVKVNPCDCDGA